MVIESLGIVITLIVGVALGAAIGWLVSRGAAATLQRDLGNTRTELEKERAVHGERLKAYGDAEARMRDTFQS